MLRNSLTSPLQLLLLPFSLQFLQFPPELLLLLPGSLLGSLYLDSPLPLHFLLQLSLFLQSLLPQAENIGDVTGMAEDTSQPTDISL